MINIFFKKNNSKIILFLFLLIFFSINKFFLNSFIILNKEIDLRMIDKYGFCEKQGFGFIKHVLNKYNISGGVKIINSQKNLPSSDWMVNQFHQIDDFKFVILLNYNEPVTIGEKIFSYQNCFFVKK